MKQLPLPGMSSKYQIVNVASVKHRSPFRYPGGKTWLVSRVFAWLMNKETTVNELIEPFAGGSIVGLSVAFEQLAQHITLVELDAQVAAVWETIITSDDGEWLADQILNLNLTPDVADQILSKDKQKLRERALQTIVRNRINRGGILAQGAGRLKNGENGRGIRSRWYPETLATRIRDIGGIRDRLSFIQGDGLIVIEDNISRSDIVLFIDPPYTASSKKPGKRLYDHSDLDHERLFDLLARFSGDFLMTYNNVDEVKELAQTHGSDHLAIPMKNTHHARLTELLIGRNLDWARR